MKIKEIMSRHRRDFRAIYECQHCGAEEVGHGYDDDFFHEQVIPAMKCGKCGKRGNEVTSAASIPVHAVL